MDPVLNEEAFEKMMSVQQKLSLFSELKIHDSDYLWKLYIDSRCNAVIRIFLNLSKI